jgi:Tfp pilus assembly protein PilN
MMKTVNLIPAARRDAKRSRRRRTVCAAACCAYAMLLACGLAGTYVMLSGSGGGESTQASLAATDAEIDRLEKQAGAARGDLSAANATIEANRTVAEQPDWSVLLALLANTTGEDVVLRSVLVAPPPNSPAPPPPPTTPGKSALAPPQPEVVLELSGIGQSQLAVSQHVLRLEQTGLFAKVTLLDTAREAFGTHTVIAFRLQCQFGEPRQPVASTGGTNP